MTDGRVNNGRKPRDLSGAIGTTVNGRDVTGVEWRPNGTTRAQMLVLKCPCGAITRMPPSHVYRHVSCRTCCPRRGRYAPAPRKPDTRRRNFSKAVPVQNLAAYTVCECTWRDGRQVRVCAQHRKAA